ncbi:uncharacterized protein C21orf58 homolog [Podargus strigoides]
MTDPSVVDHLTRLQLKLLEKRLENEQENLEKMESPLPGASNRRDDMLQSALRRRKDLLQELREQQLLEELSQPPAAPGGHCHNHRAVPPHVYQIPFPAPPAEPPRIIQQTLPQPPQPATIIQQLPQPLPLVTQIPPAQPFAAPRSGSIKEDMVEMMLMQNAQMHQIIMQNMMLKALPPMAFMQPAGASSPLLQHAQQDLQFAAPLAVKADRPRPSAVHHHHHYPPTGVLPVPHGGLPSTSVAHHWTSSTLPALPTGHCVQRWLSRALPPKDGHVKWARRDVSLQPHASPGKLLKMRHGPSAQHHTPKHSSHAQLPWAKAVLAGGIWPLGKRCGSHPTLKRGLQELLCIIPLVPLKLQPSEAPAKAWQKQVLLLCVRFLRRPLKAAELLYSFQKGPFNKA